MTRGALLATFTMMLAGPLAARAQVSDADYKAKREQLAKELAATQKELAEVKGQRAQLVAYSAADKLFYVVRSDSPASTSA